MERTRSALLVGWRRHAVAALAARGYEVTCALTPGHLPQSVQQGLSNRHVVVDDCANVEQVFSGLARCGISPAEFQLVCSEDEFTLVAAAVIGVHAGASGLPVNTSIALRDKFVQKELVRRAGLPVADCVCVDSTDDVTGALPVRMPFVVKPFAGAAAADTHVIRNAADADRFRAVSPTAGPWLVEEFIDGAELHIDGVVRDGVLHALGVSRYLQNIIDIRGGGLVGSVTLDPCSHADLYRRVDELATAALRALGYRDGIFHLEAFQQPDRLVFSECGGRSGGGMVREAMVHKFGVDLGGAWADALIGAPAAALPEPDPRAFGWVNLPAPAGRIRALPGLPAVLARTGVVTARIDVAPGDTMPDVRETSFAKAGVALVSGPDDQVVAAALNELARWFFDAVEVADAVLPAAMQPATSAG